MEDVSSAAKDLMRHILPISQEKFLHFRNITATSLTKCFPGDQTSAFLHRAVSLSLEKAVNFWEFSAPLLSRYFEMGLLRVKQIVKSPTEKSLVEKSGGILSVSVKGITAICFGWLALKVLSWWFAGGRGGGGSKMMKAPGRSGVWIPRNQFEGNPKGYFRKLRSS